MALLPAARGAVSAAAEPGEPSGWLQATVLRQMKSAKPKVRAAAVAKLEEYRGATAARLLADHGLASPFVDLRHASYKALLAWGNDQEVCDLLLDRVKKSLRTQAAGETTCGMLGVLLASRLDAVKTATRELLGEIVQMPGGRMLVIELVDELGLEDDPTSLASLVRLSKLAIFEHVFALRRAVVRALAQSEQPEAVDALIEILARVEGEVRADIARRLTEISGEPHALDAGKWRTWWKANRAAPVEALPNAQNALVGRSMALRTAPDYGIDDIWRPLDEAAWARYYDLPIYAQRLVFVIDTSGSMSGARLDAAKRELLRAVADLPPGVWFNVLVFNMGVFPFSDTLLVASPENKARAAAFVLSQFAVGATWSYEALAAALAFDVEAIYFVTDGQPSGGSLTDPTAIVTALTQINRDRLVSINTLGIGVGLPGSTFDIFLQSLATWNHGDYRRVDQ